MGFIPAYAIDPSHICINNGQFDNQLCRLQVLSEALTWMATAIQEFGLKQLDVKQLIEWMKTDVNSTSAPVRAAAIALLGVAHRQLGPGLDPLLSQSVKPALMQTLRDTFKANPVQQVGPHYPYINLEPYVIATMKLILARSRECNQGAF